MKKYMNRFRLTLMTLCSAAVLFGSSSLFSNEAEPKPFPEFVKVVEEEGVAEEQIMLNDFISNYSSDYFLERIHADSLYHCVAFSDRGDVVQLHDYSKWEVSWDDRVKVLSWVADDEIVIHPTTAWFSFYKYELYNITTGQRVGVNLISSPMLMGSGTFHIANIEPYQRLVLLTDHTVWRIGPDVNFSKWRIGQRLIVGVNAGYVSPVYPQILINVDLRGEPSSEAVFYGYPIQ